MRDSSRQSSKCNIHQSRVQGGEFKIMKKGLSLLVAFALVFSMFTSVAFAATTPSEAGQKLQSLGIILGDQDGNLMEDADWKRQDVAVLLSRLLGQEEEAKNTPKSHTYADVRGTYYDGYLSWARENGYMIGHSDTEFGFDDPITVKEFLTVILRALGYDPDFSSGEVEELAVELGLVEEGTDFSANAKRGDTYVIIVTALDTEVAGTGQKLGTVLGLPGYEVVDPAVTGVTALNLKQVKVTFNKPVDKASAEKLANYKVYNSGATTDLATGGSVALQSDNSSVIITLGTALNNGQNAAKITVEGVQDTEGRTIAKFEGTFAAVDNTVPSAVGVAVVGPRDVEVEFSEPVKDFVEEDFTIDDGAYIVTGVAISGNKVKVTAGLDLSEGEHKIKVNGHTGTDYAGFKPVPTTLTFTLVKDTTAPVASILSVSPSEVKIGFNKPVVGFEDNNVRIRHTFNNDRYEVAGDSDFVSANETGTEYTVNFAAADIPIPLGANRIYISYNDANNGPFIRDLWGNKFEATALEVNVSLDTTKPTVSEVKFVDPDTLLVVFSKSVDETTAEDLENYVVKDSAGNVIEVQNATRDINNNGKLNEVTLDFETNALGGGTYTIEIKGVKDTALVANIMDPVTLTLTVQDQINPTVSKAVYTPIQVDATTWKVKVFISFSEQMNTATFVHKNFLKKMDPAAANFDALDKDNDKITAGADGKSVTLELSGYDPDKDFAIKIGAVTDLAGNGLQGFVSELVSDTNIAKDDLQIADVVAISKRQVKIVFNNRVSSIDRGDFVIQYTDDQNNDRNFTITSIASHTVNKDGNSEVVFNLSGPDIATDATINGDPVRVIVSGTNIKTKSFLGTTLATTGATGVNAGDGIAPEVESVTFVAATTSDPAYIDVKFTEDLDGGTISSSGLNGFSVSGGGATLTKATLLNSNTIRLEGTNFKKGVTLVSYNEAAGIADDHGNKVKSFSNKRAE